MMIDAMGGHVHLAIGAVSSVRAVRSGRVLGGDVALSGVSGRSIDFEHCARF